MKTYASGPAGRFVEQLLGQGRFTFNRQAEGYDIAIVGHTHEPGRMGDWYFNTGSWATTKNNFVRITSEGDVKVFDWVNGKPTPNETVLEEPECKKEE
jgi:hypothetical protein